MRCLTVLISVIALASAALNAVESAKSADEVFAIRDGDKVVIYGDSITAAVSVQTYPRYVEAYIRTRFPTWTTNVWNRGQSGDVASNIDRFKRDCLSLKPDVILFNMGMNDAAYKPSIGPGIKVFSDSLAKVAASVREINSKTRLVLISPILYENRANGALPFYPYVLRSYSMEEREFARRLGLSFIDLDRGYGESIGLADGLFPGIATFSGDGVHPATQGGHLFIACRILQGLGAGVELASLDIDAATSKVLESKGVSVEALQSKDGSISFSRKLTSLPFPVVSMTDGIPYCDRAVAMIVDVADSFNRDTLRVRGLTAKAYSLSIDDKPVAEISSNELADGINLSRYFNTPDQDQAVAVSEAVGCKQILQNKVWRLALDPKADIAAKTVADDDLHKAEEALAAVSRPTSHRVTLSPLDHEVDRYGRYEQMLDISGPPAFIPGEDGSVSQEVKLSVKNLSSLKRHVEFIWSGAGVSPATSVDELAAGEQKIFTFVVSLNVGDTAPRLRIKHQPSNLSFPPIIQEYVPLFLPQLEVFRATAEFKPDGDFSEFANAASIDLERFFDPSTLRQRPGPGDFTAKAFVQWNDENLQVAVVVKDQDHVSNFTDNRFCWDDSLGVSAGRANISIGLTAKGALILPENAASKGVRYAVVRKDLETIYELIIPWTEIDTKKPEPGSAISFNLTVNDRDCDESHKVVNWGGTLAKPQAGTVRLRTTR